MTQPQPQWQPLSMLPTIAWAIDGMAESAEEQLPDLREAATRPHVMDNATIDRVLRVYTEQKADLWLYAEQLTRWRNQSPTPAQIAEITRLEQRLAALRTAIDELLLLAQQIRPHTIDAILVLFPVISTSRFTIIVPYTPHAHPLPATENATHRGHEVGKSGGADDGKQYNPGKVGCRVRAGGAPGQAAVAGMNSARSRPGSQDYHQWTIKTPQSGA